MNGLFIACLGLSFRKVSDYHLALFSDIIDQFGLNITRIKELNDQFPNKFPREDTQYITSMSRKSFVNSLKY